MRLTSFKRVLATGVFLSSALIATGAMAQADLDKAIANPGEWAAPGRTFDLQRYSTLDQINASNVGKLQVAWTFSTGVLRGHEGAPLVIGDMMYVHTPFPNIVFALDLNNDGKILWKYEPKQDPNVIPVMCCDTVNRGLAYRRRQDLPAPGRHHAGRARRQDRQGRVVGEDRRSRQGRDRHRCADGRQGQGLCRRLRRRVRRARLGHGLCDRGRQAGLARLLRWAPTTTCWSIRKRPPISASRSARIRSLKTWQGDQWKIGGGATWGWYWLRSEAQPDLLRVGQSLDLEPGAAARRQQVVDDDLRPRCRYRHGEVGLSDDAA